MAWTQSRWRTHPWPLGPCVLSHSLTPLSLLHAAPPYTLESTAFSNSRARHFKRSYSWTPASLLRLPLFTHRIHWRFIWEAGNVNSLCLSDYYSIGWTCYGDVTAHLLKGCWLVSQPVVIRNNTAADIHGPGFSGITSSRVWGKWADVQQLGLTVVARFLCQWQTAKVFPGLLYQLTFHQQSVLKYPPPPHPHQCLQVSGGLILTILSQVVWYLIEVQLLGMFWQ